MDKKNPLCCVFLPGYTWDAALHFTMVFLENIQDLDLRLIVENDKRSGIFYSMVVECF